MFTGFTIPEFIPDRLTSDGLVRSKKQRRYKCNTQARTWNHCCRGKTIRTTHSKWMSIPLVIHHAKLIHRITLTLVAYPALPYFSTLSHKRHNFLENATKQEICVVIFSTTFASNISRSKNNWVILSYMYIGLHVTYPLFLPEFNKNWLFTPDLRKILKYQISWKSVH
jgi:hypothetical protein